MVCTVDREDEFMVVYISFDCSTFYFLIYTVYAREHCGEENVV
jgi:hypothetical protein